MNQSKITQIIEALLFAASRPLSRKQLQGLLPEFETSAIKAALESLRTTYNEREDGGISLDIVAEGYQFRTRADVAIWVSRLHKQMPAKMSRQLLEALAIVAYRQPVTRAEIDAVRGVDSGGVTKALLEKDLIRIVGRRDVPGRPQLFGTTKTFLEVFGLENLDALPPLQDDLHPDQHPVLPLERQGEPTGTETDVEAGIAPERDAFDEGFAGDSGSLAEDLGEAYSEANLQAASDLVDPAPEPHDG